MCRNLNYWDSVSTLAGEVPRPHKTVPAALASAVVLVVLTYALPLLVGLGVTTVVQDWKLGYFAYIAEKACPARDAGPLCILSGQSCRCCCAGRDSSCPGLQA